MLKATKQQTLVKDINFQSQKRLKKYKCPSVCNVHHKSKPQNSIKSIIPPSHNLHHHSHHYTQHHTHHNNHHPHLHPIIFYFSNFSAFQLVFFWGKMKNSENGQKCPENDFQNLLFFFSKFCQNRGWGGKPASGKVQKKLFS